MNNFSKSLYFALSIMFSNQTWAQVTCQNIFKVKAAVKDSQTRLSMDENVVLRIKDSGFNRVFGKIVAFNDEYVNVKVNFIESPWTISSPAHLDKSENTWKIKRSDLKAGQANLSGTTTNLNLNQPVLLDRVEDQSKPQSISSQLIIREHLAVAISQQNDFFTIKNLEMGGDYKIAKKDILAATALNARIFSNDSAAKFFAELKTSRKVRLVSREYGSVTGTYEPMAEDVNGLTLSNVGGQFEHLNNRRVFFSYGDIESGTILVFDP